jgi:twitching motility protein PilJ
MSVVNQFGKLFNRKPEESDTGLGADVIGGGQNVLTTGSIEGNTMRESYQTDAMNSVQGDPDGVSSELSTTDADEDLISLPLLGSNTAAGHQRNLLALLAIGVVLLALIAGWVLRQADRSAQQLAATGQSLMQSQRLPSRCRRRWWVARRPSRMWWRAQACWPAMCALSTAATANWASSPSVSSSSPTWRVRPR